MSPYSQPCVPLDGPDKPPPPPQLKQQLAIGLSQLAGARTGAHAPPSRGVNAHGTGTVAGRVAAGRQVAGSKFKPARPAAPPVKAVGGPTASPPTSGSSGGGNYGIAQDYEITDDPEIVPSYVTRTPLTPPPATTQPNNYYQNVPNSAYTHMMNYRSNAPVSNQNPGNHVTSPGQYINMSRDAADATPPPAATTTVSSRINMFEHNNAVLDPTDIEAKLSVPSLDQLGSTDNKRPVPRPRSMAQTSLPSAPTVAATQDNSRSKVNAARKPAVPSKPALSHITSSQA